MSKPWSLSIKDLAPNPVTAPTTHSVTGSFIPPAIPSCFGFHAPDLFQSIARCTALKRASAGLTAAILSGCEPLLRHLVDDIPSVFAVIDEVKDLEMAERTAFSGRVGAGIADLFMSSIVDPFRNPAYLWRDAAQELIKKPSKGDLADFVYEYTSGEQVLVEAKGSITRLASQTSADKRAKNAFKGQVARYLYHSPTGASGGTFGPIEHGYAIAIEALPGATTAWTAAFTAVAEPNVPPGTTTTGSPTGSVITTLRLGNYRAVFFLANAPAIVGEIDVFLDRARPQRVNQQFWSVTCGGEEYLIGRHPIYQEIADLPQKCGNWIFAINRKSALVFLQALAIGFGATLPTGTVPPAPDALLVARRTFSPGSSLVQSVDGFAMLMTDQITRVSKAVWEVDESELKIGKESVESWAEREALNEHSEAA